MHRPPRPRPAASSRSPATTTPTSRSTRPASGTATCRRATSTSTPARCRHRRPGPRADAAQQRRSARTTDTRTIYTFDASATDKLKSFDVRQPRRPRSRPATSSPTARNPDGALTQCGTWAAAQQTAATDDAMIDVPPRPDRLRGRGGQRARELFRDRTYALGDIVNASPVFVQQAAVQLRATPATRRSSAATTAAQATVYVGANDGMLHAFDADTGEERWAYVPTRRRPAALQARRRRLRQQPPLLRRRADHGRRRLRRLRPGGPSWSAASAAAARRSTRSTSPIRTTRRRCGSSARPQDVDMGYSYGNAILTKRASDGQWVVLFASGYNNNASGGDAKGRLYVRRRVHRRQAAARSSPTTPCTTPTRAASPRSTTGCSTRWSTTPRSTSTAATSAAALWRFDLTAEDTSQRLGRTSATAGNQPITVRPELARIRDSSGNYHRVIYFGTGRYLGFDDLAPTAPSSADRAGDLRGEGHRRGPRRVHATRARNLVEQTLDASSVDSAHDPESGRRSTGRRRTAGSSTLPVGERVNVDLRLQLGTLVVVSNKPEDDYCIVGGKSWLYALDYKTGAAVQHRARTRRSGSRSARRSPPASR